MCHQNQTSSVFWYLHVYRHIYLKISTRLYMQTLDAFGKRENVIGSDVTRPCNVPIPGPAHDLRPFGEFPAREALLPSGTAAIRHARTQTAAETFYSPPTSPASSFARWYSSFARGCVTACAATYFSPALKTARKRRRVGPSGRISRASRCFGFSFCLGDRCAWWCDAGGVGGVNFNFSAFVALALR